MTITIARAVPVTLLLCLVAMQSVSAGEDKPRLHAVEAVCIDYRVAGRMQQGSVRRCHRDYAHEQFEIHDITIGAPGFKRLQKTHNITIADTVYAIDLAAGTATRTKNPLYEQLVASARGKDPRAISDSFLQAMKFAPTRSHKDVADTRCQIYKSPMMGTMCLTGNGLMLEQSAMGTAMTAVTVTLGDGGDDADYRRYESMQVTDGPDLSNMPSLEDLMEQR